MNVIIVEGRSLDRHSFMQMTGHEMACGCFMCGKRIGVHIGQMAYAHVLHKLEPTILVCCPECKEEAVASRIPGDGDDLERDFPPIEFKLSRDD
jgi:hypothetical protein